MNFGTSQPDCFITFAIDFNCSESSSVKNVMAFPCLPARPVLPESLIKYIQNNNKLF